MELTLEHLQKKRADVSAAIVQLEANLNATRGGLQLIDILIEELNKQEPAPCEEQPSSSA